MVNALKERLSSLNISKKVNLFVLIITLATTISIGVFSYLSFKSTSIMIIGGEALRVADGIAAGIDGDAIQNYDKTNKTDESWNKLTASLSAIKARNGAAFIYIMSDDGDKYKYIAEGHIKGKTDDISKLGETDDKSVFGPEAQYVLDTGKSTYTDIIDNGEYGKLISGFTPIKNKSGKTVALLGVDISANEAIASINRYILQIAILLIACEIFLIVLLRLLLNRLIIRPLKEITVLEEDITQGRNDIHIEEKNLRKADEIGDLFHGFKTMSGTYGLILQEINNLALQHRQGNTSVFIEEDRFSGIYKDVVHSVNSMAEDYHNDILKVIDYMDNISNGNFEAELERFPGQKAFINEKIDLLKANLKRITAEMNDLVTSAINGDLQNRADIGSFNGDWQRLMLLLNSLLDAVIEPILESGTVLNELADGQIGTRVTGDYKGSYATIKESLNRLTAVIGDMTRDVETLASSTIAGDLSIRADAGKYNGEYRKIVEYMNNTVDAVQRPVSLITAQLDRMAEGLPTEPLHADFSGIYAELIRSTNALTESIANMLIKTDSLMLAARRGDLNFRAGTDGLKGEYAAIVASINSAMDAIIKPIEEIADIIQEISYGNLKVKVEGDYQGNINILKENVNLTINTLNAIIEAISAYTGKIAVGDINLDELPEYSGDYNKISASLNTIVGSLNEMLSSIWVTSEKIAAGSQQIADGSRNLSIGASEQSSSVEQLTATIGEIASQTQSNAQNAVEAGRLANTARQEAETGNAKMTQMLQAMSEINSSSQDITKIIKTIDDLAFQTNILALNAAIEAASAGQYGKGFAVVAEEVRSLAAKSAEAARSTDELIRISISKVEQGSAIANETAASLQSMHVTINQVDELVANIVTASNEQATGIAQINKGIESVSDVVQTNAAASEESSASSDDLSSQAESLKTLVGRFNLRNTDLQPADNL